MVCMFMCKHTHGLNTGCGHFNWMVCGKLLDIDAEDIETWGELNFV